MTAAAWHQYAARFQGVRRRLVFGALLSFLGGVLLVPVPLLVRDAFDRVIPSGSAGPLLVTGAILVALQVLSSLCAVWARVVILQTTKHVIAGMRRDAFTGLLLRSRSYFTSNPASGIHDRVVHGTERVDIMSNALLAELLPSATLSLGVSLVLIALNWRLFALMATILPLNVVAGRLLGRRMREHTRRFIAAFEAFSRGVLFVVRAIDLVRIRAAEAAEHASQVRGVEDLRAASERMAALGTAYTAVQQALMAVAGAIVLIGGGSAVASGSMTIGGLLSFFAGLMLLRVPLNITLASLPRVIEGTQSLGPLMAFLADSDRAPYAGARRITFTGCVAFEDVTFSYSAEPVLAGVSLTIEPGETVALVGPNGAGKSTLVNLLLGFYRPQRGRVTADGVPLDDLDIRDLRRQIAVVTQEPIVVPGSVRDNLLYGAPDLPWADVLDVCRRTGVDRFVTSLPLGYDTLIGEEAARLSGGQRQRLSIARALLGRPALLVLDEPLNHLDEPSGEQFFRRLVAGPTRPAVLLISHRPDVLSVADRVIRLEQGCVVPAASSPRLTSFPLALSRGN